MLPRLTVALLTCVAVAWIGSVAKCADDAVALDSQTTEPPPPRMLRVGIKESVPFSMHNADGSWTGISVELWRRVADDLGYAYEFVELPLDDLFTQLESGEIDAAIAALTVTHDRERRVDFSHAYFNTGLSIAIVPGTSSGWTTVLQRVFSTVFLEIIAGIMAVLVVTGVLVYIFERRANPENFGKGPVKGIANGIWWAAVTMTTVGYGDRVPKTLAGRFIAVIWMFAAILIISSFTAAVTSTLTLARLESNVRGPHDLHHVRVATVMRSTSATYLAREGIPFQSFESPLACMTQLHDGEIDAVVYDAPILRHLCLTRFPGELEVIPATFEKQDYAIALSSNSPLREPLNQVLLEHLIDPKWQEVVHRYLGSQER